MYVASSFSIRFYGIMDPSQETQFLFQLVFTLSRLPLVMF